MQSWCIEVDVYYQLKDIDELKEHSETSRTKSDDYSITISGRQELTDFTDPDDPDDPDEFAAQLGSAQQMGSRLFMLVRNSVVVSVRVVCLQLIDSCCQLLPCSSSCCLFAA